MSKHFKFSRMELAGSLGDLGTLLPLAVGMIMINHLNPVGIFIGVGSFYILSGLYFRVTSPVEPMKVISAYAIATGITAVQIQASCLWIFIMLILIGATGLINVIGRNIPKSVIRGVQLSTGILLLSQGVRLMLGTSSFQIMQKMAEPHLLIQHIGFLPIGVVIGSILGVLTLLLLDNKRLPAAVVVVGVGIIVGVFFGNHDGWAQVEIGFTLPQLLPYGLPTLNDFSFALLLLVLPQVPMTIGNAVIANADLSAQYFPEEGRRVTYKGLCISMALANLGSFFIGGMPMCQGAGGLASRYRFGARTAGSNMIIGTIFLVIALFFGAQVLPIVNLLPMSVLGVLLIFAGAQLALTILDMQTRKDLFVIVLIVGITLASNLAAGFLTGIVVVALLRWEKLSV
ncbi:MAG: putative sulfate/molybdate transporter [Proteobacteria bacterium]|nr:putative sulfate/molybdate transporter [Pseudomonadota bacterium]MBU1057087.1 putative sulfate/molybdate transporter [Pseudomonadota bacterium]